jgi:hypothetical protein
MQPLASAPPAAPLPRQSGAEAFWNSLGHGFAVVPWSVPAFLLRLPGGDPAAPGGRSLDATCLLVGEYSFQPRKKENGDGSLANPSPFPLRSASSVSWWDSKTWRSASWQAYHAADFKTVPDTVSFVRGSAPPRLGRTPGVALAGSGQPGQSPCSQKGLEGHPCWSCAPGARALRRASLDGRSGTSTGVLPVEIKASKLGRSISLFTRWTRAVGDQPAHPLCRAQRQDRK